MVGAAPADALAPDAETELCRSARADLRRRALVSAAVVTLAGLSALAGVSGASARSRTPAAAQKVAKFRQSLPALWGLELVRSNVAQVGPQAIRRLHAAGINTIVVDPRILDRQQLARAMTASRAAGVTLVAVAPTGASRRTEAGRYVEAACRTRHRLRLVCATRVGPRAAIARSRRTSESGKLLAVRLRGPEQVAALSAAAATGARVLALPRLETAPTFSGSEWETAIAVATHNPGVDLAASPSEVNSARAVTDYLGVLSVTRGDAVPPSTVANLIETSATPESVSVSWSASSDNKRVAGYTVYRNGTPVVSTSATGFTLFGLSCSTGYLVSVDSYDHAGNHSVPASLTASTSRCFDAPPPPPPPPLPPPPPPPAPPPPPSGGPYVAQSATGSANGSSCANAYAASFFNTAANWGANAAIAPGSTVRLCGTITTTLSAQGNGASGSPVTIRFEPGAKLSQPVCPTSGCLNLDDQANLVVDGANTGIVQNTDNGTNLGYRTRTTGVSALRCQACEVKDLKVINMYVRTGRAAEVDNAGEVAVKISGVGVSVHGVLMHDASWALRFLAGQGDSGRFYDNEIYNIDHGFVLTGPNGGTVGDVYFYGNHLHDFAKWDSDSNFAHHDGIHCYTIGTAGMHIPNLYIYNNVFDGTLGVNATADIFLEGKAQGTNCNDPSSNFWIFNNVFAHPDYPGSNNPAIGMYSGNEFAANNTLDFPDPTDTSGICIRAVTASVVVNNAVGGCNSLIRGYGGAAQDVDHNAYVHCHGSFNCFDYGGLNTGDFALYQAAGLEPHSVYDPGSTVAGSNAAGVGQNLSSRCVGALLPLCSDINGKPRPAGGPWNAGATS